MAQLHGRANLAPWTVPTRTAETIETYRFFAKLHTQLVPFFYSLSRQAQPRGEAILFPQGEPSTWPGDYRYQLGEALLVAPILDGKGIPRCRAAGRGALGRFLQPGHGLRRWHDGARL